MSDQREDMQNKIDLLQELKIDRESEAKGSSLSWVLVVLVVIGGGAVAAFFYFQSPQTQALEVEQTTQATKPKPKAIKVATTSQPHQPQDAVALTATGYVIARRVATVSSKITGKVEELFIEEGDQVQAGDLMARLDSTLLEAELRLAESQLSSVRSSLDELNVVLKQNRLNLERINTLHRKKLASLAQADDARLNVEVAEARIARLLKEIGVAQNRVALQKERLRDMEIRAPFSGIVIAKTAQPGEMISPVSAGGGFTRTGIGTLVDMSSLEAEVDVSETNIRRITKGQPVSVVLNAYPDLKLP
ncbi:MAG: efflux RND transporter periplasmic adaptor subunit [Pseudomonadota bacterium]